MSRVSPEAMRAADEAYLATEGKAPGRRGMLAALEAAASFPHVEDAVLRTATEAAIKACPFANRDMLTRAVKAAAPYIAAAERERIRQAACRMPGENWYDVPADLLEES